MPARRSSRRLVSTTTPLTWASKARSMSVTFRPVAVYCAVSCSIIGRRSLKVT